MAQHNKAAQHNKTAQSNKSVQNNKTAQNNKKIAEKPIYHKLAPVYDHIMKDVDYEDWTDYIDSIIRYHHPFGSRVLELACGTGTMALALEERDDYEITATDASAEMIRVARMKGRRKRSKIAWLVQNMCRLNIGRQFDIIFMVFDSLNYLHKIEEILSVFESAADHLDSRGIFIFDFTTPNFSPKIAPLLDGEQHVNRNYRYSRKSRYNSALGIHTNHFIVEITDPKSGRIVDRFEEIHDQRIWTLHEIASMVMESNLRMLAAYDDFDFCEATEKSDRITMVLAHG